MSFVYFVHAPSVNLIKIGRSFDPERRFTELRLLSPVSLEVIGMIPGDSRKETELHTKFSALHSHGEWFFASKELIKFAHLETLDTKWMQATPDARQEFLCRIGATL